MEKTIHRPKLPNSGARQVRRRQIKHTKDKIKAQEAIEWVRQWKNDRDHWKFSKAKQYVLLEFCFDKDLVPKTDFAVVCEFFGKSESDSFRGKVCAACASLIGLFKKDNGNEDLRLKTKRAVKLSGMMGSTSSKEHATLD